MTFDRIDKAKQAVAAAREELAAAIEARCPGAHKLVQHRDGLAPWCHSCGRTATGDVPSRRTTRTAA